MQTEIFASCIYNGAGHYVQGEMQITKSKVSVKFDSFAVIFICIIALLPLMFDNTVSNSKIYELAKIISAKPGTEKAAKNKHR